MKYQDFYDLNAIELYNLWYRWTPKKKSEGDTNVKDINDKPIILTVYDRYDDFVDLYDYNDRVCSFRYFMFFAYENSIP